MECQRGSTETLVPAFEREGEGKDEGETKGIIPRKIRAKIKHEFLLGEEVRENLVLEFKRYHRVQMDTMSVEINGDIRCYYHLEYVISRILEKQGITSLVTDLTLVPEQISKEEARRWSFLTSGRPMRDENFTYSMTFLHNETFFLCELVVRSLGMDIENIENDLPMDEVSPNKLGTCPFCGTWVRERELCSTCGRAIPEKMDFREFMKLHSRRQFLDKLYTVKATSMRQEARDKHISQIQSRLRALKEM